MENCTSCKDEKTYGNELDKCIAGLGKKYMFYRLNYKLNEKDFELNKRVLCEGCKEKKIGKLTDKYGNEEMARFLYYQCKLNAEYYYNEYIRWIPFNKFKNIKYLAKGSFGEVRKATWINRVYYYEQNVFNSSPGRRYRPDRYRRERHPVIQFGRFKVLHRFTDGQSRLDADRGHSGGNRWPDGNIARL